LPAEKIAVGSEGAAEGGCGGNSAAPERKLSEVSVGIFAEKSSDFVQEGQPMYFRKSPIRRFFGRIEI